MVEQIAGQDPHNQGRCHGGCVADILDILLPQDQLELAKLTKKQAEKTKFKSKSMEATLKAITQVSAEVVQEECTQEFHSMLASIGIATSRRSVETRKGKFSSFIQRAFGQIKVLTPAEAQRRLHVWMDIEEDPVNGQRFQSANWRKQRLYKLKCGSEPSGDDPEAITNLESIRFIREFLLSE